MQWPRKPETLSGEPAPLQKETVRTPPLIKLKRHGQDKLSIISSEIGTRLFGNTGNTSIIGEVRISNYAAVSGGALGLSLWQHRTGAVSISWLSLRAWYSELGCLLWLSFETVIVEMLAGDDDRIECCGPRCHYGGCWRFLIYNVPYKTCYLPTNIVVVLDYLVWSPSNVLLIDTSLGGYLSNYADAFI